MVVLWASLILVNLLVFPDLNFTVVNDKYHLCFMCEGNCNSENLFILFNIKQRMNSQAEIQADLIPNQIIQ